jgi:hypothetical protein
MSVLIWLILLAVGGLDDADQVDDVAEAVPRAFPPSVPAGATDDEIEWWFLNRPEYRVCGYLDGSHLPWDVAGSWHCLQQGAGVDGTELAILDEGADPPRQTYYRLTPAGRLEIITHVDRRLSDDGRRWHFRECTPSADLQARPCA